MENKYLTKIAEKLKSYSDKGPMSGMGSRAGGANLVIHVNSNGRITRSSIPGERHGLRNTYTGSRHGILKSPSHKDEKL